MRSVIFLTEKRDGTIKTRNCIDGSSMRVWMNKDHTASPTVGLNSLMITCVIDAKENRDVATVDKHIIGCVKCQTKRNRCLEECHV